MNWDDLQPFLALLRAGSLSGAARALGCEHATIARRIDRLEADLGQRLFDRLPRGWRPTPEAQALAPQAEAVEAAFFALRRQAAGGEAGPVRISAPPLFAAEVLVPRLGPLIAAHPGVQIALEADPGRADLGRGEIDLALRIGPVEGASLRLRKLCPLDYRPYGLPGAEGVILTDPARTEPQRWITEWAGARAVVLNTADSSVMRAAVHAGLGIALLPAFYAGDLPPVGDDRLTRTLYLTLHEDKARAPRVRRIADALAALITDWARAQDARTISGPIT